MPHAARWVPPAYGGRMVAGVVRAAGAGRWGGPVGEGDGGLYGAGRGAAMGSRLRPVALCGAVLAAAGGAAVAAWAWAYVRGRARRPPPAPAEQVRGGRPR